MADDPPPNKLVIGAIDDLCSGVDLDEGRAQGLLTEIMSGRVSAVQVSAVLIALRAKGETPDEIAGLARAMRDLATPVRPKRRDLVDTAGTGGGRSTFNVSTTAAMIAAGAGVGVAKHGNRSNTSASGSADLLEALNVPIDLDPDQIAQSIDRIGFGFMFAPSHHSAMRYVVPVRKALGTRTVFNLLGPLTNPAGAARQLVGVGDPQLVEPVARALARLGSERSLVVASDDGLDEFSTSGRTRVFEVRSGEVTSWAVEPEDVGLERSDPDSVSGSTPEGNAAITRAILDGELGAPRDLAVLNAGATIMLAGESSDLAAAVRTAEEAIDSGAARAVLAQLASDAEAPA